MLPLLVLLLAGHHALTRAALTTPKPPPGWPIVRHPHIAHLMPYVRGDSLGAIWVAARVLRRKFIDQNAQCDADDVPWVVHWSKLRKIGVRWLWTGHYDARGREVRRRLTDHELSTRLTAHPTEYVARLRFRAHGGRRLHQVKAHMARCAKYDITLCLEGKSTVRSRTTFDLIAAWAVETGVRVVFMRLQNLPGWREPMAHALDVGLACALLPRLPRPVDWPQWRERGVQRWGHWRV